MLLPPRVQDLLLQADVQATVEGLMLDPMKGSILEQSAHSRSRRSRRVNMFVSNVFATAALVGCFFVTATVATTKLSVLIKNKKIWDFEQDLYLSF